MVTRTLWSVAAESAPGFSKQRTVGGSRPPLFDGRLSLRESSVRWAHFRRAKGDQNRRHNEAPFRKLA